MMSYNRWLALRGSLLLLKARIQWLYTFRPGSALIGRYEDAVAGLSRFVARRQRSRNQLFGIVR